MTDWLSLNAEGCLRAARAAPIVAYPWEDCNTLGGGVKIYAEGMWTRRRAWPTPSWMSVAYVQPETPGPGWSYSLGAMSQGRGGYATAEEAMHAADAALSGNGVRLLYGSRNEYDDL